ncbi:2Fe-2S iron-sulfur cluster-binding protein [Hyphomicrobium sp.]|uniref:2Fe-2S iron-sulfur cluster-binding protein n=1 Tax=Hyphomicrobium sp. TaxID=82 RepID=UPI002FDF5358
MTEIEIFVESDSGLPPSTMSCQSGVSLMEALRSAGHPIEAACGGSLACATCHVILSKEDFAKVGDVSEDEEDMLDQAFGVTRTSRLACQIMLSPELSPLRVRLPSRP